MRVHHIRKLLFASDRARLLRKYPNLAKNKAYWGLLMYLHAPMRSKETGEMFIPSSRLAAIEGKPYNHTYCGAKFLSDFQRNVLPGFRWGKQWSYVEKRARVIESTGLDDDDESQFWMMQHGILNADTIPERVYAHDGTKFTRQKRAADIQKLQEEMLREIGKAWTPEERLILEYHYQIPVNTYSRLVTLNRLAAFDAVRAITKKQQRDLWLSKLDTLLDFPKPYYGVVARSDRPYPMRGVPNLTSSPRAIRRALMKGCVDLDLICAQLSIIARIWRIPELERLLQDLASKKIKFWDFLAQEMGSTLTPTIKDALKVAVYTLCFGGCSDTIEKQVRKDCGITLQMQFQKDWVCDMDLFFLGRKFLQVPIIKIIRRARYKRRKEMKKALAPISSKEIRSKMAQEAQAVEQLLVAQIYKVAMKAKNGFTVLVYSYDGVTIQIHDRADEQIWLYRIRKMVEVKAKELGIFTSIEAETL